MAWLDVRILTDTDEQMEKVKNKVFELLMEDEDVYDFSWQAEGN